MFARDMKWGDDFLSNTTDEDNRRRLLQLALYAQHLGTGNTIFCRSIKVATVKAYTNAAASFMALFGNHPRDARKEVPTDAHVSRVLSTVYDELHRWETVPNRREPFAPEMLRDVQQRAADPVNCQRPNSLLSALADWFQCALFAGFRLSEWAQDAHHSALDSFRRDMHHDAKALCLGDVRFEDANGARVSSVAALQPGRSLLLTKCWVKFRTQKNGENGEEKLFSRHDSATGTCFVSAMLRILQRFARLRGLADFTTPLGLYGEEASRGGTPRVLLITSRDIETLMRETACRVYHLHPLKDRAALQMWSAHSLRVGACVILHTMGFTESQIKWILRWRSNAFMVYLRNTAVLARQHVDVMDAAFAMPHFL
jgi:hypothetical protein